MCGQLTCDGHATCTMTGSGAACACIAGYSGDGMTCAAIDPCANNNGGCAAACAMTGPGMAACYTPQTCADVAAHVAVADDTSVTLYAGGDASKPWTAYCHSGLEYLTLASGAAANFGQYTVGGKSTGTTVKTAFTRVRIDPATFDIDVCDQTFATSTGMLYHDSVDHGTADPVTSMCLGIAMDCAGVGQHTGVASIDLTGEPFVVDGTTAWTTSGVGSSGMSNSMSGGRAISIDGGGNCGWEAPSGAAFNPFNTFTPSNVIGLLYMP